MALDEKAKLFLEKIEKRGSILGLQSMQALMNELDNPQEKLQIIHIAGTNGKGSCLCMLESIFIEEGYRVGKYTSPAVFCYQERFSIDGKFIDDDTFSSYLHRLECAWENVASYHNFFPTIFEVETALAYLYFYEMGCDYVLIETGMGGSLDATNVYSHNVCSIFASIGRDHMQFLGQDIAEIAKNKAGIMKEGCLCVSTYQEEVVSNVLEHEAKKQKSKLFFVDKNDICCKSNNPLVFSYKEFCDLQVNLSGSYQLQNATLVLETILLLQNIGIHFSEKSIREGLKKAYWPGRMEKIASNPDIYLDGAHNLPAMVELKKTIHDYFTNKNITYIIGVLADKEYEQMLIELLPMASHIFTVTPDSPRALSAKELADTICSAGFSAVACDSLQEALDEAIKTSDDTLLAFGSLSYLGAFKKIVHDFFEEK